MKNPVNRLATAAPRALDTLLQGGKQPRPEEEKKRQRERAYSFQLDLSGLSLESPGGPGAGGSVVGQGSVATFEDLGGSVAEEGSVAAFEDPSEFTVELGMNWNAGDVDGAAATATGGEATPN